MREPGWDTWKGSSPAPFAWSLTSACTCRCRCPRTRLCSLASRGPPSAAWTSLPRTAGSHGTTSRARSCGTSAAPGRLSATSWGSGPGWPDGARRGPLTDRPSTSSPGTWRRCPSARSASMTWPRSSRRSNRPAVARPGRDGRMEHMPAITQSSDGHRPVRDIADAYVDELAVLNPILATTLGRPQGQDLLPDLSPAGEEAQQELGARTLARLAAAEATGVVGDRGTGDRETGDGDERRCARLLRERLETEQAIAATGEHLRSVSNIFGPPQRVRSAFLLMPTDTQEDWATIGRRIAAVTQALVEYRESLTEGAGRGLYAAPRQVETVAGQLADWHTAGDGSGWFAGFAAGAEVPAPLRADLDRASASADAAVGGLRDWLLTEYLPATAGTPDGVGAQRYAANARRWLGASPDLAEAYEWGWAQYREIMAQMQAAADGVLPGASPREAMLHLDSHSETVLGVDEIRGWLQDLMDEAMADLDGTHFDLAGPLKVVEARIAPPGSAAAPYYTAPSQDFSRPGRTWLPTMGHTTFPVWGLYSTWYHEGVPSQLSTYQTAVGGVSANTEGWALYAERLMDELGYLEPPGARMGYLDAQLMRAIRVIIDIGMHLQLTVAGDSPMFAGQTWTPELALDFFDAHVGRGREFLASEVLRYLGMPGQAIRYKLGGREGRGGR